MFCFFVAKLNKHKESKTESLKLKYTLHLKNQRIRESQYRRLCHYCLHLSVNAG
jgi:hypothetical protein